MREASRERPELICIINKHLITKCTSVKSPTIQEERKSDHASNILFRAWWFPITPKLEGLVDIGRKWKEARKGDVVVQNRPNTPERKRRNRIHERSGGVVLKRRTKA